MTLELELRHPEPGTVDRNAALREAANLVSEAVELDAYLLDFLDRWHHNERRLVALALRSPGTEYMSRELRNAIRMRAPLPFWYRDEPEPPRPPIGPIE